jgi:hypothetical protein
MTNDEILQALKNIEADVGALITKLVYAPVEEGAPAETKPATLEQVRAAMTDLASAKGADAAKQLLAEYGAKKLGDVAPAKYASLLTDAKAWANE